MINNTKNILVTCALPYANGPIHVGHMLEHIQADIWVRYQRMIGKNVYFICADDSHGSAIMLKAQEMNIDPEEMIKKIYEEHKLDFLNFNISYNNYYLTHSDENFKLLLLIYNRLKSKGLIKSKIISQLYDPIKKMFLPDRFIKGICPICKKNDQYGDNCENCGSTYKSTDLINPYSSITREKPILKKSKHIFFDLPIFTQMLKKWIISGSLQKKVSNKITEWFKNGLKQWDISRDKPYFGFNIPDEKNKYFYVWMDATIGYISSFKNLCKKNKNIKFKDFWDVNCNSKLYQFIGKDIIYFHSLFWPAILEGSGFRKPTNIFVHGHVTLNGKKMSKSKNVFIKANTWIKHLDADSLRYYYASKLSSKINDIDLNLLDLIKVINTELINKIINLASRNAKFINELFSGILSNKLENPILYQKFINHCNKINIYFKSREFNLVIRKIIYLADLANKYIDKKSPWKIKNKSFKLQEICSMGINLFRILMIMLKPIIPDLSKKSEKFLKDKFIWNSIYHPLLNHKINKFKFLYFRITKEKINSVISD